MESQNPPKHPSGKDSSKGVVRTVLDVMAAHGVRDVVCSPGSRNAPLLMGVRARDEFRKHIAVDERAAAFMALGIASVRQQPVALVCTSGTALLNYAPAVAEAYYQGIPLIVLSADRPTEWIDQDDSQTIRQFEALRNYVKGSYDLSDREVYDKSGWYDNRIANDAMLTALRPKQGPVHINIRLSPPLNELAGIPAAVKSPRIIREVPDLRLPQKEAIRELARSVIDRKILVTVGFALPDSRLNKALRRLRSHPNVAIMAETVSNTHLPQEDYAVDSMLCTLTEKQMKQLAPDVVISVGGALISRMLKEYLRNCEQAYGMEHWNVGPTRTTVDCFQALTTHIDADPALFLSALSAEMTHLHKTRNEAYDLHPLQENQISGEINASEYAGVLTNLKELAMRRVFTFAGNAPWSDLVAFIDILNNIPEDRNLFLSNGTTVRYAQLIPYSLPHASFCNRGVSGIEGSTSTAVGGALAFSGETVLITGDMSLAHDLGGLALAASANPRLKIIVINNRGGGIFRFVRATSGLPDMEKYLCADPALPIDRLADAFGFAYSRADSLESLRKCLDTFFGSPEKGILEVVTPTNKSALLLKQFLKR